MSIKSGQRYKITNEKTKLVVDLSAGDDKSIIGWKSHGAKNQQWITEEQDDGQWTIQSVRAQKYLGFEDTPDNGTRLVGLDEPQLWDIEILPDRKDSTKPSVKLWVRGTCFLVDFPLDKPIAGTDLRLWAAWEGKNKVWVLEEYS